MAEDYERLDASPGDRVECGHLGAGTFLRYGDPRTACPDTHVSTPGMRIVYVQLDEWGESPLWERDVKLAEALDEGDKAFLDSHFKIIPVGFKS